ncbi:right-handed parallel beta-helix repeat-containing protein, partial [bacterium]|nr:right-handed parallel beta-helix repeat-containing protein [bacterium]
CLGLASSLPAAEITWGVPTNVSDETDVSTNGTLVEAVNASARTNLLNYTVNGVEFEGESILPQGGFNGDFDPSASSGLSGTYQQLLNEADFGGGQNTSITIADEGLIVGLSYEVQIWFLDTRGSDPRVMTFSDGSANADTVDLDGNAGQFAIGTFVADGTSQALRLLTNDYSNAHLSAYQLRLLSGQIPNFVVTTREDELDTPSGTDLSLREALRDAVAGSNITFDSALDGELIQLDATLFGQLVIDKPLTIDASSLPKGITIDGGSNDDFFKDGNETRCFLISDQDDTTNFGVSLHNLTIQKGVFEGNNGGGNIHNRENLTLTHCDILDGRSFGGSQGRAQGGGIRHEVGNLTMSGCTVSRNQNQGSVAQGGGIASEAFGGSLTMTACTISENQTHGKFGHGGGIAHLGGTLTITACTVSGNQTQGSDADGGGIASQTTDENLTISASTVFGNQVQGVNGDGGGVSNSGSIATIEHCTIVGNVITGGIGSGIGTVADTFTSTTISHSIIQDNLGGNDIDLRSFVIGSSIFFRKQNLVGSVGADVGNITLNTSPILLAPLANYGGPTETMPPLPSSPAIDTTTGSDATEDQRGFSVLDVADIGSVEFQGEEEELNLSFDTDGDQDGLSVGLELGFGTNPFVTDFENPNRPQISLVAGVPTLSFGVNDELDAEISIVIERSESLRPDSFLTVGFFTLSGGINSEVFPVQVATSELSGSDFLEFDFQIVNGVGTITEGNLIFAGGAAERERGFYRFRALAVSDPITS